MSNLHNSGKFLPYEAKYLAQFNDNPHCVRAVQMALTHLDIDDEVNVNLLRRLSYVAAVAAQSVDDDVFICSMLHPLAEYKHSELAVIMTGLGFEALKVVEAIRETQNVADLYVRISALDSKYKAIVVARVMYRLLNIELYEYAEAESILQEASQYTVQLDAPMDIMIQLGSVINHAKRIFSELYIEELLEDAEDVQEDELIGICVDSYEDDDEYEIEIIAHKKLADELGVGNRQEIDIEGIGKVTYYDGCGFCDSNGEAIVLSKELQNTGHTIGPTVDLTKVNLLSDDFDYETRLHKKVAKSLDVVLDKQVVTLGEFGKAVYYNGVGFCNDNAEMIKLRGSVFDYIDIKYAKEPLTDLVDTETAIEQAKHHRLATMLKIQDQETIAVQNVGKVTYSETLGFIDELGHLVDLEATMIK